MTTLFSPRRWPAGSVRAEASGWLTHPDPDPLDWFGCPGVREVAWPVRAQLAWSSTDPYAVHATFHTGDGRPAVAWVLSRELLAEADQHGEAGFTGADVRASTQPARTGGFLDPGLWDMVLCLSTPAGAARIELPTEEMSRFLDDTFALVPAGTEGEHIDIAAAIAAWLDGGTA